MEHRHFSNSFNVFGINQGQGQDQDQDQNHLSAEQSYISMGRGVAPDSGSFVYPTDNMLRGVRSDSHWTSERRPHPYPSSCFGMEAPLFPPAISGPPPYSHSAAVRNLYLASENNDGPMHFNYYNRSTMHEIDSGLRDSTVGAGRGPFKRKSRGVYGACDRSSTSRFYGPGSSSRSSEMLLDEPTSGYQMIQITPPGPIGLPHYIGHGVSIASEDTLRNVRSRSMLDFEPNTVRPHISSYSSGHYHFTSHPANHSGTVNLANLNADATTQQWNCYPLSAAAAHGRIPTSGISGSSHEANHLLVGASSTEICGYHHESIPSIHTVSSSQNLQPPTAQTAREGHINYSQRFTPSYRTGPSYSHWGHNTASGLHSLCESSSRHGWHNSYRNGGLRIATDRFQSLSSRVDARDRLRSDALIMVDHSPFYGGSRFDEYQDMRLDIDNMSYEDLLALGERIGNVSAGLSESMISSCLRETVSYSLDQNHAEDTCVICLEEYKNEDEVGTLKNCGHDFHVGCIRKWLLMKNVCPICKIAALKECSKQE